MKRLILVLVACVAMAACGGVEDGPGGGTAALCQIVTDCGAVGYDNFCDGSVWPDEWDYDCAVSVFSAAGCQAIVDRGRWSKDPTSVVKTPAADMLGKKVQRCYDGSK